MHCKQLFPDKLVKSLKCINVHPGYNPINRGWYPQVFAIINILKIGATIHEIDTELDHGPIIARRYVEKDQIDTSETLYNKILIAEIELIEEHLISILENTYITFLPESEGVLYLKNDFKKLCKLNLDEKMSTLQFIDKLRALTYGGYKNAYFIDSKTQKKIYVNISLEKEQ
jgi:methionyl-tRNA formyltransferase